ncbi:MAG TPA: sulfotransferase domain-containing protein [Chloroflexota bacterium]|nr:sulfotransferase domain-containing protein [Chloroflexota bacterium]
MHTTSSLRSTLHHYQKALRAADRANVVVCHYGDLQADLEGEMRRLADRLGIAVAERVWPALVEAASFERMRARADHTRSGRVAAVLEADAAVLPRRHSRELAGVLR